MVSDRRHDRFIKEWVHDPYKSRRKPVEATVCSRCGALFRDGRWQWAKPGTQAARKELCQACKRMADHYPAGEVVIRGSFVPAHRQEMLNLVGHVGSLETAEHPLNRIMEIKQYSGALVVNTTDIHLARRLGEALRRAHKGELKMQYKEEGCFLRVRWQRDELRDNITSSGRRKAAR